ncbi:hypothetical protein GQ53DRAFT_816989 [Thozetella sp. PMI_491]|nr:hypothetical protein GQ53DRAFT_816989 [Thozetella sp. PMI_491]
MNRLRDEATDLTRRLAKSEEEQVRLREQVMVLQREALFHVDRHESTFDATLQNAFKILNSKITAVVSKTQPLYQFAKEIPLNEWNIPNIPEWYNPIILVKHNEGVYLQHLKHMLRRIIWYFLEVRLFSRTEPFQAFGPQPARDLEARYADMFKEEYATSESAAKWRALTATRLDELETGEEKKYILDGLVSYFGKFLQVCFAKNGERENVQTTVSGAFLLKLKPMFESAVKLSKLFAKDRAGYSLGIPDLKARNYRKGETSDEMTTRADFVGIGGGGEYDAAGTIMVVVSPMLLRWGEGSGKRLGERTILLKSYVEVDEVEFSSDGY